MCGAESWDDVEDYGDSKRNWLATFLDLKNGIPSHDTFNRLFQILSPAVFETCFIQWVKSIKEDIEGDLLDAVISSFSIRHCTENYTDKSREHGRIETLICSVISNLKHIDKQEDRANLASIVRIESERMMKKRAKSNKKHAIISQH